MLATGEREVEHGRRGGVGHVGGNPEALHRADLRGARVAARPEDIVIDDEIAEVAGLVGVR